eukprot:COSAG04_NODE_46_length_31417_cov_17.531547_11_plen_114_part_00
MPRERDHATNRLDAQAASVTAQMSIYGEASDGLVRLPLTSAPLYVSASVLASSVLLRPAPSCGCPRAAASDLLLVRQTAPAGGGAKTAGPLVQLQAKWGALDDKQQNIVLVVA